MRSLRWNPVSTGLGRYDPEGLSSSLRQIDGIRTRTPHRDKVML